MEQQSSDRRPTSTEEPGLGQVVLDDLRHTKLRRDFLQEFRGLYDFYLDGETRAKLAGMGRLRRAFTLLGWLFKSLLLKLSPGRRILLLLGLVFTALGPTRIELLGRSIQHDFRSWGALCLLVILMLELKDKLLAKDEIQIAREVQMALLPHEQPDTPGWLLWNTSRPANDVGGDLVDYIALDGFRHGVTLGDVAGKGLGAALLSAKLQATMRALTPEAVSLDDLATRVNTIFVRDGLANRFATLFYCEIEHDSGHVRYLNAGHNPAYVIRTGENSPLRASSLPLGMLEHSTYTECETWLEPGDVLVIYSDGLTEAENSADEEFGDDRLRRILTPRLREQTPEEIGSLILTQVDRFVGDVRPRDDLSLVIMKRDVEPA